MSPGSGGRKVHGDQRSRVRVATGSHRHDTVREAGSHMPGSRRVCRRYYFRLPLPWSPSRATVTVPSAVNKWKTPSYPSV